MAKKTAEELKKVFADGERPTGDDFSNLIDSTHGGGTSATIVPVSTQIAQNGTNSTGFVSPAGVKAYVDAQKATKGEAEAGLDNNKLITPLRAKEAITTQVTPLLTTLKNSVLGGVSTTYNTLQKLLAYVISNFYTRSQSDTRYERKGTVQGGVSTTYNTLQKLLAYVISNFYTRSQSDIRYERKGTVQGGVSTAYNTLKKLLTYLNGTFYTRSQSDSRYDRSGNFTNTGKLKKNLIPSTKNSINLGDSLNVYKTVYTNRLHVGSYAISIRRTRSSGAINTGNNIFINNIGNGSALIAIVCCMHWVNRSDGDIFIHGIATRTAFKVLNWSRTTTAYNIFPNLTPNAHTNDTGFPTLRVFSASGMYIDLHFSVASGHFKVGVTSTGARPANGQDLQATITYDILHAVRSGGIITPLPNQHWSGGGNPLDMNNVPA